MRHIRSWQVISFKTMTLDNYIFNYYYYVFTSIYHCLIRLRLCNTINKMYCGRSERKSHPTMTLLRPDTVEMNPKGAIFFILRSGDPETIRFPEELEGRVVWDRLRSSGLAKFGKNLG